MRWGQEWGWDTGMMEMQKLRVVWEGPRLKKSGRAPPVGYGLGAYRRDWLRPGAPTAPAGHRLPLLPSSPGGVHEPAPRGTRPSTPFPGKLALAPCRGEEFHPAVAGCGYRAPPAPRVARPLQPWYAGMGWVSNAGAAGRLFRVGVLRSRGRLFLCGVMIWVSGWFWGSSDLSDWVLGYFGVRLVVRVECRSTANTIFAEFAS